MDTVLDQYDNMHLCGGVVFCRSTEEVLMPRCCYLVSGFDSGLLVQPGNCAAQLFEWLLAPCVPVCGIGMVTAMMCVQPEFLDVTYCCVGIEAYLLRWD